MGPFGQTFTTSFPLQEAVRRVCGALGIGSSSIDAAVAAGELLELLESLPEGRSSVEASIPHPAYPGVHPHRRVPILTSPDPQRGRSPSPSR